MANFIERYKQSGEFLDYARQWTPTGAQTISKASERFPVGAYPVYLDRGLGAYCWDVDGNRYLDMICGLASLTLGYRHPAIDSAITKQLERGISFSLATILESETAERLCSVFPCGRNGSVRFVKTGSEANEGVIRIARRATGRDVIVTVKEGYHSWHSAFSAVKDVHPGIPKAMETLIRGFHYNDIQSLKRVLDSSVAAVIMEPTLNVAPGPEFLQAVVDAAHQVGALVVFDEVVCAGRWAHAGGQEFFNITPDLATAGKGLANGMPLGCIIGSRDLMQYADVVSGTFGGETLSLAACNAVLDIYQQKPIIDTLWARGRQFQDGVNLLIKDFGIPAICDGFPVKPRIRFTEKNVRVMKSCSGVPDPFQPHEVNNLAMSLFVQELAERGVLWHPAGGNISAAMTERDIDFALSGVGGALAIVKRAIQSGDWSALRGQPIKPSQFVRGGA